jgi:hypothetical protein
MEVDNQAAECNQIELNMLMLEECMKCSVVYWGRNRKERICCNRGGEDGWKGEERELL